MVQKEFLAYALASTHIFQCYYFYLSALYILRLRQCHLDSGYCNCIVSWKPRKPERAFRYQHSLLEHLPCTTIIIITTISTLGLLSFQLALYVGHVDKSSCSVIIFKLILNYFNHTTFHFLDILKPSTYKYIPHCWQNYVVRIKLY